MSDTVSITGKKVFVALVVIVAICLVLGCLAIFCLDGLIWPDRRAYFTRGILHNIYTGLEDYNGVNGHLPPATATDKKSREQLSWRVEVLISLDRIFREADGSIQYDRHKAWNDAENLRFEDRGTRLFRYTLIDACPPGRSMGKAGTYTTYYKAITGPDTAFDPASPQNLKELPRNLIIVVRVEESDTHWMEPGDLSIDQLTAPEEAKRLLLGKKGYAALFADGGYAVLFADGEGWVLSAETPISDLSKFFTVTSAEQFDKELILGPYRILPRRKREENKEKIKGPVLVQRNFTT